MAWIKIEHGTIDKPEVLRISRALKCSQDEAFTACVRVWWWFDANTEDGTLPGIELDDIDNIARRVGMAAAMVDAGWLRLEVGGLSVPNFENHNGETAKRRATANRRVAKHRACNASVTRKALHPSNASVTPAPLQKALPDKRREEKTSPTEMNPPTPLREERSLPTQAADVTASDRYTHRPDVDAAWSALPKPRRRSRTSFGAEFIAALGRGSLDPQSLSDRIVAYYASPEGTGPYCREAARWLREDGWDEPPEAWERRPDPTRDTPPVDGLARVIAEERARELAASNGSHP